MPTGLLFDNGFLTDIRTGAAGAVAAECLARRDADTVGRDRLRRPGAPPDCLPPGGPPLQADWSPGASTARGWNGIARRCAAAYGIEAEACASAEDACRQADILITATPSHEPMVRAAWLRPGLHVTAVGSDTPGKQELDAACLARADLVVVDRPQPVRAVRRAVARDRRRPDARGGRAGRSWARWWRAGSPAGAATTRSRSAT